MRDLRPGMVIAMASPDMTMTEIDLENSLHPSTTTGRPPSSEPARPDPPDGAENTLIATESLTPRRPRARTDPPAARLGGWTLGRFLGAGSTASVFEATHPRTGQRAAVKVLGEEHDARFEREIAAHARLGRHDRVVALLDSGIERVGGRPVHWLAFELASDGTLRDLLRREGRLPPRRVLPIVRDLADGLAALHAEGLVHRDLKPENVLLDETGARLTDLGLIGCDRRIEGQSLTVAGAFVGTVAYASPEQVEGRRASEASDLWSLGVIAFELLTGKSPFARANPFATAVAVARGELPLEATTRRWRTVLRPLLALDPAERGSAPSLRESLDGSTHGGLNDAGEAFDQDEATNLALAALIAGSVVMFALLIANL